LSSPSSDLTRLRRIRRLGALFIAVAGVVNLVSATTPPLRDRLRLLRRVIPLEVPHVAAALVALAGIGLLVLSSGLRRGQRRAWCLSIVLLAGSALLHLLKGADLEEAAMASVGALLLVRHRRAFRAGPENVSARRAAGMLATGGAIAMLAGTITVELTGMGPRLSLGRAVLAVVERFAGFSTIALPDRSADVLNPVLGAIGFGLALGAGWLMIRPLTTRRCAPPDLSRARAVVRGNTGDTLAYFALRDDKEQFFWGESMVAYAVFHGVCLVSPDPVGPPHERAGVWGQFHRFADNNGWCVAVLGASEDWLPVYRLTGMRDVYIGDEAIVDVNQFALDGGRFKGLRQAVNRVARHGYHVEFFDPACVSPELRTTLRAMTYESRRGEAERGFSMTLGRIFDPRDKGLLLAVAFGPDGTPAAFCHFVPAPAANGYSLDVMHRTRGDHPNGVLDFVLVSTIEQLRARGMRVLGLNFAVMRAVLARELGDGMPQRLERWMLGRLSNSMQIETLWRFTAKYDPEWMPRFAVYDAFEQVLPAALAVARAESFWELPLVGRFLTPPSPRPVAAEV
jgi:lysylphosphatidylglycerol synthetase-like protein (DUF2156 family)